MSKTEALKQIKLYAILETEQAIASLKSQGKISRKNGLQDAYYNGLVRGLTMRLPKQLNQPPK